MCVCVFRTFLPLFQKLDAEVEYTVRSWESLRGVQERLEVKEEEVLSCVELLKLQKRVKDKIQQSESILNRTSSFHLTAKKVSGTEEFLVVLSMCYRNCPLWDVFIMNKSLRRCQKTSDREMFHRTCVAEQRTGHDQGEMQCICSVALSFSIFMSPAEVTFG